VPYTIRNPLYHWTHLELKRPFGITDKLLSPKTAKEIYDHCNALLTTEEFRAREIMQKMNVKVVCTTDDPVDTLEYHQQIKQDTGFAIKVLPAFRPDKVMAVESPEIFNEYIGKLEQAADVDIRDYDSLLSAVKKRHDFFHEMGCRLSDHGLETVYAEDYMEQEIKQIFGKVRSGKQLEQGEILQFKSALMIECGRLDHARGWTQQLHLGALRNNNTRLFKQVGPDTGFDSIGDFEVAQPLSKFLDRLDITNQLPKTILYNMNPNDNEVLATMIGNFQDGSVPGKMQFGSGWWFLDQKDGMERQMNALSNMGLLSWFVGMLTDSRSFLSYPRHEYFRRILCNLIGNDVENGELPDDIEHLGKIVQDICYNNAVNYFGIEVE
jgi:glucuronate isomerase